MENRFICPEDLWGRLGKKESFYKILTIDCKLVVFSWWYSRSLSTSYREMSGCLHEGLTLQKEISKINKMGSIHLYLGTQTSRCDHGSYSEI